MEVTSVPPLGESSELSGTANWLCCSWCATSVTRCFTQIRRGETHSVMLLCCKTRRYSSSWDPTYPFPKIEVTFRARIFLVRQLKITLIFKTGPSSDPFQLSYCKINITKISLLASLNASIEYNQKPGLYHIEKDILIQLMFGGMGWVLALTTDCVNGVRKSWSYRNVTGRSFLWKLAEILSCKAALFLS